MMQLIGEMNYIQRSKWHQSGNNSCIWRLLRWICAINVAPLRR